MIIKKREYGKIRGKGRLRDIAVQTDKLPGGMIGFKDQKDKFKKFFFAVFYTYMMMNSVMVDALPKK